MVNTIKFSQFPNVNLNTSTNMLVGVSSSTGGINFQSELTTNWTTANRPTTPPDGLLGYNINLEKYEYWNATAGEWIQLGSSDNGTVTEVGSGIGLTGGPINTTGTLSFSQIAPNSLWANNSDIIAVPTVIPLSTFLLSENK